MMLQLCTSLSIFMGLSSASRYTKLSQFNIDPNVTISGLSGGGSFAMHLSFIYSSWIRGAGIFAGGHFPVFLVTLENPLNFKSLPHHIAWIDYLASKGWIDNPYENMPGFKAYVYHGGSDQIVPAALSELNYKLFEHYGAKHIHNAIKTIPSGHCFPVKGGGELGLDHRVCSIGYLAICACGYDGINQMLATMYPDNYKWPQLETGDGTSGSLFKFDQDEFFPGNNASAHGFKQHGWAYVPLRCRLGHRCKLHFAFHGCGQNLVSLLLKRVPEYILETGYLEAADSNDLIILFPQTFPLSPTTLKFSPSLNFVGCYDFYSFTSPFRVLFATRWAAQPVAIKKMFERIHWGS